MPKKFGSRTQSKNHLEWTKKVYRNRELEGDMTVPKGWMDGDSTVASIVRRVIKKRLDLGGTVREGHLFLTHVKREHRTECLTTDRTQV